MNMKHDDHTPNEIPTKTTPHKPEPLKDPLSPNEDNPINPKKDLAEN